MNRTICLALLWAGLAQAEPETYAGKLGNSDIVVELTGDPAVSMRRCPAFLVTPQSWTIENA